MSGDLGKSCLGGCMKKMCTLLLMLLTFLNCNCSKNNNNSVDLVIFSYDRPMQLYAYLESIKKYITGSVNPYVLYRASNDAFDGAYLVVKKSFSQVKFFKQIVNKQNNNFKELVLDISFKKSKSPYIMYGVDDIIMTDYVDLKDCVKVLEESKAYAFYLRLGKNITQCYTQQHNTDHALPTFKSINHNFLLWQFSQGVFEWAYPHSLDMTIYRKLDINETIKTLRFTNPNQFEGYWGQKVDVSKFGICYQKSKLVNLPINIVQNNQDGAQMGIFDKHEMLTMFDCGLRIDIQPLHDIKNKAPHMEVKIKLNAVKVNGHIYEREKEIHEPSLVSLLEKYVPKQERKIIVVIPSYKNKAYYQANLDSVAIQKYSNWTCVYVDDNSPDSTGLLVKNYIEQNKLVDKFVLIQNTNRYGALANLYNTIHACPNDAIIVTLDGDDWFAHEHVLSLINKVYDYFDVWLTYGQYICTARGGIGASRKIPQHIINNNSYRSYQWVTSHVKTFYAGLFKKIDKKDLMIGDDFFSMAWDYAVMFPMLEMSGGHFKFIPDILYIYNNNNPINDDKLNAYLQEAYDRLIRTKKPYARISTYK